MDVPLGYDYIGNTIAIFNTDYWHYSNGFWLDGDTKEEQIDDNEMAFWQDPEIYYDRPGMNIAAEGSLPKFVYDYINAGNEIILSVTPRMPDSINMAIKPTYQILDDNIYIYALPYFKISKVDRYPQYVPDLVKFIPIVNDKYGWNVYSIYKNGVHIGELPSSFASDDNAIEFIEILDSSGRLRSDKTFDVNSSVTGRITRADAQDIRIGDGSFVDAGSVGMWFQYVFDVKFYKHKAGDLEAIAIKGPNRIETGKNVDCVVTVRNNSTIPYRGEHATLLRIWDGHDHYEINVELSPGEEKDV
ncbi:MAG: hypothetical protein FWH01_14350, partial [Oscillospiraceae bacterium]|nr:hypothetical protein [Oscillospiraceae bacterium]